MEQSEHKEGIDLEKKYKFKELKVYASTEWLADNKKKYRQVFDRYEVAYIYAELSFYNRQFDRKDWPIAVKLRAFSNEHGKRKELCELILEKTVSKHDPIVYLREGWGNRNEGSFWKRGTYCWEVWINDVHEATKYFYIEDADEVVGPQHNPYFDLRSVRVYEGPFDDVPVQERVYHEVFEDEETRYIYGEFTFKNLNTARPWQCEFFAKFYNGARELKGQIVRLQKIDKGQDMVTITAGWGSNVKGSWRPGDYTLELVFMDHLQVVVPFEVDNCFIAGVPAVRIPYRKLPIVLNAEEDQHESFDEVLAKLDQLIGLGEIKKKVREHANYLQFLKLRREFGFSEEEDINIHSVFIGNPGTGKTTVAQMMGKIYRKMGLLSSGHVHQVDRVDLVGEYIGQTAPKVKEAIEKARGGVLFIDEAYALARTNDDTKDFGREVIEILMKEMSNGAGDLAVIAAGYPKEMLHFLNSNPGLKSRFKLVYRFSDYMPQELAAIAQYACTKKEIKLTAAARKHIQDLITDAFRRRDRSFGNARFVFDLLDQAKINLGLRIMRKANHHGLNSDHLKLVRLEDVQRIDIAPAEQIPKIPIDTKLLEQSLKELDGLIGMIAIKKEIHELVTLVRYYRTIGKSVMHTFNLHTVFIGNPGTGKTTVARILTKIYKALGILERGHMVETDRQGLVAGFVGQTAIKTAERIDEAMGGVLFIDEAYALTSGSSGASSAADYGNEVVQTILKRMEDHRGAFFVFAAGYPENMESFLKANPGLRSRFDKILRFKDYSVSELVEIAQHMFLEKDYQLTDTALEQLKKHLSSLHNFRDQYFGNARSVRNVVEQAIKSQNLRMSNLAKGHEQDSRIIQLEDVQAFRDETDEFIFSKKRIGFRSSDG
ncbi:MAG: AAA family ATPase [Saprospiraceae bacterium]|nr:AAA family ATPase [Saprospiraceae bacterium]